ncbi:MAG TPA: hypothetical protein VHZ55_00270 [Bryobacteraceae bacterium]|nr:hypothetical protein [Bryobacteraceae bacterium]
MKIRNCAWEKDLQCNKKAVWARGRLIATQCPKSVITAQSLRFLELFQVWKGSGGGCDLSMDAKSAEAILILEQEWMAEQKNEQ